MLRRAGESAAIAATQRCADAKTQRPSLIQEAKPVGTMDQHVYAELYAAKKKVFLLPLRRRVAHEYFSNSFSARRAEGGGPRETGTGASLQIRPRPRPYFLTWYTHSGLDSHERFMYRQEAEKKEREARGDYPPHQKTFEEFQGEEKRRYATFWTKHQPPVDSPQAKAIIDADAADKFV